MRAIFDFRSIQAGGVACPLTTAPARVETSSVDRDGLPVEGAEPPFLKLKAAPFHIEFSHETPPDIYPSSEEYFSIGEGNSWEGADVFSSRSSLRNLARSFWFPVDDYYCRDFAIDAAFLNGKLFLQRHPDSAISQQEEGYGIVFERAMTTPGNPEVHAFHEFLSYSLGDHTVLMRSETDCLEKKYMRSVGLTTKKLKRKKNGRGYYDLGNANYYQEQWIQMALSGTSHLIIGARDEGQYDTGVASIVEVHTLNIAQVAQKGDLTADKQQGIFDALARILTWIKSCFTKALSAGKCRPDKLAQAEIVFSKANGVKTLIFNLSTVAPHMQVTFFSDKYVLAIAAR